MSQIVRTYTFTDGTTAYGSQVETEFGIVATAINNLDAGTATWANVKGTIISGPFLGSITNDAAATGYVGEFVTSKVTSNSSLPASTHYGDVTALSLTAGDWDVWGLVVFHLNGATMTHSSAGISTTTGDSSTGLDISTSADGGAPTASNDLTIPVVPIRFSLSTTTSVYLKVEGNYSAGTPQYTGYIAARRRR